MAKYIKVRDCQTPFYLHAGFHLKMVNVRYIVLVTALVVCGCSAAEQPAEVKEEGTRTFGLMANLPNRVQQLGAALNPINAINTAISFLPTIPGMPALPQIPALSDILPARPGLDGTVTKTNVIKVTQTLTRNPVCMTTVYGSNPPPCSKLYRPHTTPQVDNHNAVNAGNGLGLIGNLLNRPSGLQQAIAAIVPSPQNEVHDDDYEWDFRGLDPEAAGTEEAINIEPTVVARIPEASATVEPARQSRNLYDLEASVEELAAEGDVETKRPHPRYLITKKLLQRKPPVPTVTKNLYVTVTEKVFDSHYTATLAAQNCIPGHIPICPTKHYQVRPTVAHYPTQNPQYEAHKPQKPSIQYNKPVQRPQAHKPIHKPVNYPAVQPIQFSGNQKPINKPVWHAKDAVDKIDAREVENDADAFVDA